MNKFRVQQFIRFLIVCAGTLICIIVALTLWQYLFPFIFAFIISWTLQPFIRIFEQHLHLPRTLSILLLLLSIATFALGSLTLIIAELIDQMQRLLSGGAHHYLQIINTLHDKLLGLIQPPLNYIDQWLGMIDSSWQQSIYQSADIFREKLSVTGMEWMNNILQFLSSGLAGVPEFTMTLIVGILSTFFLSKDWDIIQNYLVQQMNISVQHHTSAVFSDFKETVSGIVRAQIILMSISIAMIYVGLVILDIPNALTIALVSGVVDFIPYIGTGIIFIPWIVYQFIMGQFEMTICLAVLYMVIIITRQLLEPKILASHFGVHPLVLLTGLFVGFQLVGMYAVIVSPIIIAFIKTLHTTGVISQAWYFIKGQE
ncbi:sporulation integral membrane protein YtvI [Halobacillus naozhouensis]|uniref:Sporulation integral membrane protein YtvI n=1 Tax=Halobacillus naozhouensis TaxID=554880 RepID=A0ABY8IWA2_9BACI|nr:sporulation integral membrane protein YtvI [Halobacillus naozhouensis]WFT73479.1 sporulation integral membrane protein YtvI [Halobacillus naozhouensis]